jgi:acyl carrier protein
MQNDVVREIRRFVVQNFLFGQDGQLGENDSFLETGVIDSTGVLELVAFLEEKFGIAVEHDELVPANLDSLARVTAFVERKLSEQKARRAG